MDNFKKYTILVSGFLSFSVNVLAQPFSYIYIQGDKETPFYVKMHGTMLPRYGKNYNIISELDGGPVRFQVLFQQRKYPPQEFTVIVPDHGSRGFLLSRQGDSFALYDLQRKKYLTSNDETTTK